MRPHDRKTEDDVSLVQKSLREFAKDLQRQGEIPLDVSDDQFYNEVERHVPQILAADLVSVATAASHSSQTNTAAVITDPYPKSIYISKTISEI